MENATKALIISGGVLVGIIILSLGVYLFHTMGSYMSNTQSDISENVVTQFNNEFLKYNGRKDLGIQDVITVKNFALENNQEDSSYDITKRAEKNNGYIDVYYGKNFNNKTLAFTKDNNELLKTQMDKKFTCTVEINDQTGRVYKIFFYEN